jgi:hypothetical protein
MAVTYQARGAILAYSFGLDPLTITAPVTAENDILIAAVFGRINHTFDPPAGWTLFSSVVDNGIVEIGLHLFWKRAVAGDSEADFEFNDVEGVSANWGLIFSYRGCVTTGSPLDATTPSKKVNGSSDLVTYADFDPTETEAFVAAVGVYGLDNTTAGAMSGENPTLANNFDMEHASGISLFGYSAASTGAPTGVRSHTTTSGSDDKSVSCVFGLKAAVDPPAGPVAITFRDAGNVNTVSGTELELTAPELAADDLMIAVIYNFANNKVVSVPAGWTKFVEVNNTANQRLTLAWKRAVAADSGAVFTFTIDSVWIFRGLISVWRGCKVTSGTPIDAAAPTTSANASADAITYADFNPVEAAAFVVAVGIYNDNNTTPGAIAGTNPTFVNNWDRENAGAAGASSFGYSGSSDGLATGARSHTTSSVVDVISIGCLFGLVTAVVPSAPQNLSDGSPLRQPENVQVSDRKHISWDAPADDGGSPVTGYKIERKVPAYEADYVTLRENTGTPDRVFFDTSPVPRDAANVIHSYRISAINVVGAGASLDGDLTLSNLNPTAPALQGLLPEK